MIAGVRAGQHQKVARLNLNDPGAGRSGRQQKKDASKGDRSTDRREKLNRLFYFLVDCTSNVLHWPVHGHQRRLLTACPDSGEERVIDGSAKATKTETYTHTDPRREKSP